MSFRLLGPGAWNSPAHPHYIHSPPTLLCVWSYCCCCCCCWLVHKPIFLECCLRRASPLGEPGHTTILSSKHGPIHGIKWSLSARALARRARAHPYRRRQKRRGHGARGQSNSSEQCRDSHREQRSRPTIFYCFGRPDQNKPRVDSLQGRYGSCNPTLTHTPDGLN